MGRPRSAAPRVGDAGVGADPGIAASVFVPVALVALPSRRLAVQRVARPDESRVARSAVPSPRCVPFRPTSCFVLPPVPPHRSRRVLSHPVPLSMVLPVPDVLSSPCGPGDTSRSDTRITRSSSGFVEHALPTDAVRSPSGSRRRFSDLIDKPLAWSLQVLPSGRSLAHSLLVATVVLVVVHARWRRSGDSTVGVTVAVGYLTHLAAIEVTPWFSRTTRIQPRGRAAVGS